MSTPGQEQNNPIPATRMTRSASRIRTFDADAAAAAAAQYDVNPDIDANNNAAREARAALGDILHASPHSRPQSRTQLRSDDSVPVNQPTADRDSALAELTAEIAQLREREIAREEQLVRMLCALEARETPRVSSVPSAPSHSISNLETSTPSTRSRVLITDQDDSKHETLSSLSQAPPRLQPTPFKAPPLLTQDRKIGKPPNIPISDFTGAARSEKDLTPHQWCQQFYRVAKASGWNDQVAIDMAGLKLAGSAQDWYSRHGSKAKSWDDFYQKMCNRYGVRINRDLIYQQIESMKQDEKETVEDFMARILTSLNQFGVLSEDDPIVSMAFRRGLRPAIYNRMLEKYEDTEMEDVEVGDLLHNARKSEIVLNSKKQYRDRHDKSSNSGGGTSRVDRYASSNKRAVDKSNITCIDAKKGHYAYQCPTRPKPADTTTAPAVSAFAHAPASVSTSFSSASSSSASRPASAGSRPTCSHCKRTVTRMTSVGRNTRTYDQLRLPLPLPHSPLRVQT